MKEATLNTEFGEITVAIHGGGYIGAPKHTLTAGDVAVRFLPPGIDDPEDQAGVHVRHAPSIDGDECAALARLCQFAAQLIGLFDEATAEERAKAEARRAEEEQAEAEQREREAELEDERSEILLQELVGERVKVRHQGYKTMCYGTVHVAPLYGDPDDIMKRYPKEYGEEPSSYEPLIRYSDQGATRDRGIGSYKRLDAKTERGWRTVWDDGKDDLPEFDRAVKLPKVKPWGE